MPAVDSPPKPRDSVVLAIFSLISAPLALALASALAAALRYVTAAPLAACCAIATVVLAVAWGWWLPTLVRGVRRGTALLALGAAIVGWLMLYARLWNPDLHGMATVGGGDNGHHIWIANQLAYDHPRIYQGFTSFHAFTWALAQLLGGPFEGMRGAFYLSVAGWTGGGILLLAVLVRDARRQVLAMAIAAALLLIIQLRVHLMWAHYNQADGFVAHLHSAPMILALLLAVASRPHAIRQPLLLFAAIVLFRFTYALNAGDVLLASAAVIGPLSASPSPHARWRQLLKLGSVGMILVALVAYAMLAPKFPKPGGIMAPDPRWHLAGLSAAVGACALWPRLARPESEVALSRFVAILCAPPALLIGVFFAIPSLPREYYFHKYPLVALLALTGVAPAWAALVVDRWLSLSAGERLNPRKIGLFALFALLLGVGVRGADKGSGVLRQSYRERAGDEPSLRQVRALHDPRVERLARGLQRACGADAITLLHPHWPVFNFTDNVLAAWRPAPKRPVKGLQDERWALFLHGARPSPGRAVAFVRGGPFVQGWAAMRRQQSHARVVALVHELAASGQTRCAALDPGDPSAEVCAACP